MAVIKNLSTLKNIEIDDLEGMSIKDLRASASAAVRAVNRQVKAIKERGQEYVEMETGLIDIDRVSRYHGNDKDILIEEIQFLRGSAEKLSNYMGKDGRNKSKELQESWENVRETLIESKGEGKDAEEYADNLISEAFREGGTSWIDRAVVIGLNSRDAQNIMQSNADSEKEYMVHVMEEIARMNAEDLRATGRK